MKAEEKAEELRVAYLNFFKGIVTDYAARQCAIIAVDEILNNIKEPYIHSDEERNYWQQVRTHLTNKK